MSSNTRSTGPARGGLEPRDQVAHGQRLERSAGSEPDCNIQIASRVRRPAAGRSEDQRVGDARIGFENGSQRVLHGAILASTPRVGKRCSVVRVRLPYNPIGISFRSPDGDASVGGFAVPVQLASAYAPIANGGVWVQPHLVDRVAGEGRTRPKRRRIVSKAGADTMVAMMRGVVTEDGTGIAAAVPGHQVAGCITTRGEGFARPSCGSSRFSV